MKKLVLAFVLGAAALTASAQEFKPVKIGLGLGYAATSGTGAKGGVLLYLEPAYRLSDAFAVGLRIESAVVVSGYSYSNSSSSQADFDFKAQGLASYTVNGQYYFSNDNFRPFAGLGVGIFAIASAEANSSGASSVSASSSKFGFYPRVGFDLGHFTLQAEYNIIPTTTTEIEINSSTIEKLDTKNSYLGIKAGFFISGGRK